MLGFWARRGKDTPKRKHTAEEIISELRDAEVIISSGSTVVEAVRRLGVSEQTFYRWRSEYGGLRVDQAQRLK
jgi:transposase-like protein